MRIEEAQAAIEEAIQAAFTEAQLFSPGPLSYTPQGIERLRKTIDAQFAKHVPPDARVYWQPLPPTDEEKHERLITGAIQVEVSGDRISDPELIQHYLAEWFA